MIVTTTYNIEGREITEYKGVITGEAIVGAHLFKDLFATFRDTFGGRAKAYEDTMREAKDIAVKELIEEAQRLGADAVVGVDLDYQILGQKGSMLMVAASGTAVKLR